MADPHDDSLERALGNLSRYSGPDPQVWKDALEEHRGQRQRALWVYVRKPVPAVAAAMLCVLVAGVALRDFARIPDTASNRARAGGTAALEGRMADKGEQTHGTLADAARRDTSGHARGTPLNDLPPGDITQNSVGLQNSQARNDREGAPQNASNEQRPVAVKPVPGGTEAPGAPSGVAPTEPTPLAAREETRAAGVEYGAAAKPADQLAALVAEPRANLVVRVPDTLAFYEYSRTEVINPQLGEQAVLLQGADPDLYKDGKEKREVDGAAATYNFSLRVTEGNLAAAMERLKAKAQVQEYAPAQPGRQERIDAINTLLKRASTDADAKDAVGEQAAKGNARFADHVKALEQRRRQIETGAEWAEINVTAIPSKRVDPGVLAGGATAEGGGDQVAGKAGATPVSPPAATTPALPSATDSPTWGLPSVKGVPPESGISVTERAVQSGTGSVEVGETASDDRSALGTLMVVLASSMAVAALAWVFLRRAGSEPPPGLS